MAILLPPPLSPGNPDMSQLVSLASVLSLIETLSATEQRLVPLAQSSDGRMKLIPLLVLMSEEWHRAGKAVEERQGSRQDISREESCSGRKAVKLWKPHFTCLKDDYIPFPYLRQQLRHFFLCIYYCLKLYRIVGFFF